jgi:hypothetical protein
MEESFNSNVFELNNILFKLNNKINKLISTSVTRKPESIEEIYDLKNKENKIKLADVNKEDKVIKANQNKILNYIRKKTVDEIINDENYESIEDLQILLDHLIYEKFNANGIAENCNECVIRILAIFKKIINLLINFTNNNLFIYFSENSLEKIINQKIVYEIDKYIKDPQTKFQELVKKIIWSNADIHMNEWWKNKGTLVDGIFKEYDEIINNYNKMTEVVNNYKQDLLDMNEMINKLVYKNNKLINQDLKKKEFIEETNMKIIEDYNLLTKEQKLIKESYYKILEDHKIYDVIIKNYKNYIKHDYDKKNIEDQIHYLKERIEFFGKKK